MAGLFLSNSEKHKTTAILGHPDLEIEASVVMAGVATYEEIYQKWW